MVWEPTSRRRAELPPNWQQIHDQVLEDSGYTCEAPGCYERATDVDHKRRGNDHRRSNLQALCSTHHGKKTSREGLAQRRKLQAQRKRPPERHPGIR